MSRKSVLLVIAIVILSAILAGLLITSAVPDAQPGEPTLQETQNISSAPTQDTQPSMEPSAAPVTEPVTEPTTELVTEPTTEPTEPPIVKESTAVVGAIGDILMHGPVINTGYSDGTYDFNSIFTYFTSYVTSVDYAVANMEGTLCGNDNGYSYGGYPNFNCPDAIAAALKNAGFDMLLTANNHAYDTRNVGFLRTQQVIAENGMAHTGTVTSEEEDNFLVADINGISVGMICYTYNTGATAEGGVSLNTIPLTATDSGLVNSFDYHDLEAFYDRLAGQLEEMELAGAEATILFIHWGDEYHLQPNDVQTAMAQTFCDMGIDVIIGGHPHVVQPMELLTSTVDPGHKTVCLYSMGNALSNQRQGLISSIGTAHTEDGVMMSVTFAKYSDGTVVLQDVELLPTWVNMHSNSGPRVYQILPLDQTLENWRTAFDLTDSQLSKARASYDRTMAIVGQGLSEVQTWCADHQAAVEAALGVE